LAFGFQFLGVKNPSLFLHNKKILQQLEHAIYQLVSREVFAAPEPVRNPWAITVVTAS
jgi:hypothetical protein